MKHGLLRNLMALGVFIAGLYVAGYAASAEGGDLAGLLALGFAFFSPFGLIAFLEGVDRQKERFRQELEDYEAKGDTPAERIESRLARDHDQ